MKNKNALLGLLLCWLCCAQAIAQELHSCAQSRMRVSQRQAVAAPEHVRLMNGYDVTFYKLDLQLERNSTYIAGNATIAARVKGASLQTFAFELHPALQIDSVVVNGRRQHNISRNKGDVAVRLTTALEASQALQAVIYYKGTAPRTGNAVIGSGFNTDTDPAWGRQVSWSLSAPYAAYEWWPVKQVLTDKADSVHVFVTTSAENKVGSNGLLTRVVELPNGKKRHEWKSRYPIAYYLISVAVSDYEEYLIEAKPKGVAKPIPILNYVYRGGALQEFKAEIDRTAGFLEHFSEIWGLYPFHGEKYGHSMAPLNGGIEHQTMTTQSTFNFSLTAHDLAHQWFGDNVTCASWQDIWLNEGFASYAEFLAQQKYVPGAALAWVQEAHNMALQHPEGTIKIADTTNVEEIFDVAISYKKAGSVVHMLRFEVNDDARFFQALRNYQQQYGGRSARTADLQRVFEETTGKDLDYFFGQWYDGNGFPRFQIRWNQEDDRLLIASTQEGSSAATPFFRTDMEFRVITTAGNKTIRVRQGEPVEDFLVKVGGTVTAIEVDPNFWVLKQVVLNVKDESLVVPKPEVPVLYPNPVAGTTVKVEKLGFAPSVAEIYDVTGRRVGRLQLTVSPEATPVVLGKTETQEVSIDVSSLASGVYQLLLSDGTERYHARFVRIVK